MKTDFGETFLAIVAVVAIIVLVVILVDYFKAYSICSVCGFTQAKKYGKGEWYCVKVLEGYVQAVPLSELIDAQ